MMRMNLTALLVLLIGACSSPSAVKTPAGGAPVKPMLADDGGLGPVHHWVSTKNPAAQRAFDEGLARLYGFNHDEAVKAFKRAAEADPDCVMADRGRALA